ncbi:histidine phosphatase family protein [Aestuariimicrobium ganziense]|uniref:histidine phosphatase family protein n=1 Tax=Aestuariimicrobium ganziense TaxID=2773677 RepID=UPI001943AE7B|nr:histidine phosphatase family protein [Aestuariimicrobium ganziense]
MRPSSGTRLILLRHGRTEWNATGRYQGQADVALDEVGLAQARAVAPVVVDRYRPDALCSSPLSRARRTADEVAAASGLPVVEDARLAEINVGSWSGLSPAVMGEVDPAFGRAIRNGEDYRRSPEGETATETGERMCEALRDIADAHAGQTVVVASHGLAIRMGMGFLLGWDFSTAWWLGAMGNCHWAEVRLWSPGTPQQRWRLEGWNLSA